MKTFFDSVDPQLLKFEEWPDVLEGQVPDKDREVFVKRRDAIIEFLTSRNSEKACLIGRFDATELYRLVRRCVELHPDGRVVGFRACRPYCRVKEYTRSAEGPGTAGLLTALFAKYPEIERELTDFALRRFNRTLLPARIGRKDLRDKFLALCRDAGVTGYPFDRNNRAVRALATWYDRLVDRYGREATRASFGHEAARNYDAGHAAAASGADPFTVWVMDEYTVDSIVTVAVQERDGSSKWVPMKRAKIISVKRRGSRDILAAKLVLRSEPNTADFLSVLEAAVKPHERLEFTVAGYSYRPGPCYACELSGAAWLLPDVIMLDNSKVHRSDGVRRAIVDALGATVQFGIVRQPRARGDIENWHSVLAAMFRGLASTTATGLHDPRRYKAEEAAVEMRLQARHVEELLEMAVVKHNTTPLDSLKGITPMEALREWVFSESIPRRVPVAARESFSLAKLHFNVRIYSRPESGRRPVIKLKGAEYHGPRLASMRSAGGVNCVLVLSESDASVGVLYAANGDKLDDVYAVGIWRDRHRFSERVLYMKLRSQRKVRLPGEGESPVSILLEYLHDKAVRDKSAALAFANMGGVQPKKKPESKLVEQKSVRGDSTPKATLGTASVPISISKMERRAS